VKTTAACQAVLLLAFLLPGSLLAQTGGAPGGTSAQPPPAGEVVPPAAAAEAAPPAEAAATPPPAEGVPPTATATAPFDLNKAVADASDILASAEVKRIVRECIEKWSVQAEVKFSMIVTVDAKGKVSSVTTLPAVTPPVQACIEQGLASVPFVQSPEGLSVGASFSFIAAAGKEGAEGAAPPPSKPMPLVDPAAGRLFYHQTAFTTPAKQSTMTFFDGAHLVASIGVSDHFDFTIGTMPPIGVWGLGLFPKIGFNIQEKVRMAFIPSFGMFVIMPGMWVGLLYGMTPVVSFGSPDFCFNLSLHVLGISAHYLDASGESSEDWVARGYFTISPEIGASLRVAKRVKLNLEFMMPNIVHYWGGGGYQEDFDHLDGINTLNGKLWFIMAGVRIFGEKVFGEFGVAWAIYPGFWEFQQFMPIGWPFGSIGVRI
jgi:hypothetical protein